MQSLDLLQVLNESRHTYHKGMDIIERRNGVGVVNHLKKPFADENSDPTQALIFRALNVRNRTYLS